ncbi:MAG: BMP family ABC transporter substrate-binding protein, partial [Nitrospinota bacterium]|nr:BMP family ABC transporter substrate-binding protein [Nitrospinota bacterium]
MEDDDMTAPAIRKFPLALAIFAGFLALVCPQTTEGASAKPIKAGFIYPTNAQDAGWSHAHDLGRKAVEDMPGVTTDYAEGIRENSHDESVLAHMAETGFNVIFADSFGYEESVLKVAAKFPDVIFMHCSGRSQQKNVGTFFGKIHQARYLTGLVAGAMTKTG